MRVDSIWRHPIKSIGREALDAVTLTEGRALPHDRRWAVTHERAKPQDGTWAPKANFLRGVSGPSLMAVTAELDDDTVTLHHPERPDLTVAPDRDADALVEWLDPIWPDDQPRPSGVTACDTGYTDAPEPFVSIHGLATHRAVSQRAGAELSIHRWRGNLWFDGLAPWEEFDLVGRHLRVGEAVLKVEVPITRCKATMANPDTGRRDVDTLAALRTWDHQDCGAYAIVVEGGTIEAGAPVAVL